MLLMLGPERPQLVAVTTVHRHVSDRVRWYETHCKQKAYVITLTGLTGTVVTGRGWFTVMTVHVLHAGDGYTYLTRQVASGDHQRRGGEALTDYYTAQGNPAG